MWWNNRLYQALFMLEFLISSIVKPEDRGDVRDCEFECSN